MDVETYAETASTMPWSDQKIVCLTGCHSVSISIQIQLLSTLSIFAVSTSASVPANLLSHLKA